MKYMSPDEIRREGQTIMHRFRGGKMVPIMAVPVGQNEGGMLSQTVTLELDPIAGKMVTPITAELICVFVPVQAIDVIKNPADPYNGMTEVIRDKLLTGVPLYPLENEGVLSMRMSINPVSVGGVKKVSEIARLAHNAAVNFLRLRKYDKATLLLASNAAVTPAILSTTILERLNGVLNPDDRVGGIVPLTLPNMTLPVDGLSTHVGSPGATATYTGTDDGVGVPIATGTTRFTAFVDTAGGFPKVVARLNAVAAGNLSLSDFFRAEKQDALSREMRAIVDENPEYGEEMVLRWAHGLTVDTGKHPFVLYEQSQIFGRDIVNAMDSAGVSAETIRSDMGVQMTFSVPIPRTELGGMIITFAVMKPDENIASMPHPILSKPWGSNNFVADEMLIDPIPVTFRELNSDIPMAQENTVAMYTGLNALAKQYSHYGLCRLADPNTVENKTAIWQLNIPLSVTFDNILYPADIPHFPFANQAGEPCRYTVSTVATIQTPMIFGPSPVEELAIIGTETLFTD